MTPPLHHQTAAVYLHPDWKPPDDPAEAAFVLQKAATLRDMGTALAGKQEGPPKDPKVVLALRPVGPNGALRIYYTIKGGAAFVLCWGTKHLQDDDRKRAHGRAVLVQVRPGDFALPENRIA